MIGSLVGGNMVRDRITVYTENPENELWKKLLQYSYKARIQEYYSSNQINTDGKEDALCETIIGSLLQANEYYFLAKTATLHTAPLLLYYGTINLFLATSTLLSGESLKIDNHGMKAIPEENKSEIGKTRIHFVSPTNGGINVFNQKIEPNSISLTELDDLSIKEVLLSIPEINLEAIQCYGEKENYCIPLETVVTEDGTLEKVLFQNVSRKDISDCFARVPDFSKSYLNPAFSEQGGKTVAVLRHKYLQDPIHYTSITGQSYLLAGHSNRGNNILLPQWIYMYVALYGAASLCRYSPQIWNPFIRLDERGEKLLVEKFLEISRRKLPNIILSIIEKREYSFENKKYEPENQVKVLGEHEIKDLIQAELHRKEVRR